MASPDSGKSRAYDQLSVLVQSPMTATGMEDMAVRPGTDILAASSGDRAVRFYSLTNGQPTGVVIGHQEPVQGLGFSADGTTLVTRTKGSRLHFWDAERGTSSAPSVGPFEKLSWNANRRLFVVASGTTVTLLDYRNGQPVRPPLDCGQSIRGTALSRNDRMLLVAYEDATARHWDLDRGEARGDVMAVPTTVDQAAFSHDGKLVATYDKKSIQIWDTTTGQPLGPPHEFQDPNRTFAFGPSGPLLAPRTDAKMIRFWNLATGKPHGLPLQHQGAVRALAFSPDGRILASGDGEARGVFLWDVATCKPLGPPQVVAGFADRLEFTKDGNWLAFRDENYDRLRFGRVPKPLEGSAEQLTLWAQLRTGMELQPDGTQRTLDTATWQERRARLAELGGPTERDVPALPSDSNPQIASIGIGAETTRAIAVSADGRFALAAGGGTWRNGGQYAGKDYRIRMIDLVTRTIVRRFEGHGSYVTGLALAADGKRFASGAYDGTVRLWDLESGQELRKLDVPRGYVSLAFLPDGRLLIGCPDGVTRLRDPVTGKEICAFPRHVKAIYALSVSTDGRRFLTGGQDGKAYLWSVDSSESVRLLEGHSSGVEGVAFYSQDQRAVTIAADKTLRVWDLATGKELRRWDADDLCLAISPDGRRVLSSGTGKTVRLLDLEAGSLLGSFEGHTRPVLSVRWLGQGRFLSAGHDHTLRVWRLPAD